MTSTPPLVLLPGSLCDARLFTHQVATLSATTSVTVGDLTAADSIEGMAAQVLADAPDRFAVAGLSLGAIVAMEVHRQAPERITGLALLNTNLDAPDDAQLERRRTWERSVDDGGFPAIAEELVAVSTHTRGQLDELVLDMALAVGPDAFLRQNTALQHRPDRRPWLAEVTAPVLIAAGEHDAVCPVPVHAALAERCPHAMFDVIAGAGHLSSLDRAEAVTDLVARWLATTREQQAASA